MRFELHGGSDREAGAVGDFARMLGVEFSWCGDSEEGEEPLLVVEYCPTRTDLMEAREHITRWMDEYPPTKRVAGSQDTLPGLDTPPCR